MRIEFTIIDDQGKKYSGAADLGDASVDPSSTAPTGTHRDDRSKPRNSGANALPDHILHLRNEGFFREPRTFSEVHEKLRATYTCLPDRVRIALLRLQRRRELRKAVKTVGDEERTAYVW
jgi:hypothetical protein